MNAGTVDERASRLGQAFVAFQQATIALIPTPVANPLAVLRDKPGHSERLHRFGAARDGVFAVFANMTGTTPEEAAARLSPLVEQVGLLGRVDWERNDFSLRQGSHAAVASGASTGRLPGLNQVAMEALARLYLEEREPPDPLVAETQTAWRDWRAATRRARWKPWRNADVANPKARYWSLWQQWADTQRKT